MVGFRVRARPLRAAGGAALRDGARVRRRAGPRRVPRDAVLCAVECRTSPAAVGPFNERKHPVTHRRALSAVVAALLVMGLAACGERDELTVGAKANEQVDLVLDYLPNADHAGIYN